MNVGPVSWGTKPFYSQDDFLQHLYVCRPPEGKISACEIKKGSSMEMHLRNYKKVLLHYWAWREVSPKQKSALGAACSEDVRP